MHPAPVFQHGFDEARDIAKAHPFAVITAWSGSELVTVQAPLIEVCNAQGELVGFEGHLARSNRFTQALIGQEGVKCLAVFIGPDSYVTPNSYPSKTEHGREVPTWNYLTAELAGSLSWAREDDETLAIVSRQSDVFEAGEPKPWSIDEAPETYIAKLLRAIVGFTVSVDRFEATKKLNQNKNAEDFDGAARWLSARDNSGSRHIAALMKSLERD